MHPAKEAHVWLSFFVILWLIRWFRCYQPNPSIIKFHIIYFPSGLSSQHDCQLGLVILWQQKPQSHSSSQQQRLISSKPHHHWGLALAVWPVIFSQFYVVCTLDSGWWSLECCGSPGRGHSFSYMFSFLPISSHCSHYSVMNLKNTRTEKYIKVLPTALVVSEALLWMKCIQCQEICCTRHILFQAYRIYRYRDYHKYLYSTLSQILVLYHFCFTFWGGSK